MAIGPMYEIGPAFLQWTWMHQSLVNLLLGYLFSFLLLADGSLFKVFIDVYLTPEGGWSRVGCPNLGRSVLGCIKADFL